MRRSIAPILPIVLLTLVACTPADPPAAETSPGASPAPIASEPAPPTEPPASAAPQPTTAPPAAWATVAASGGPPAREDHTWTVDGTGEVAYLFGGRDGSTSFGDLWAYDLATDAWARLQVEGPAPAPRFGHEAAWVDDIGLVVFAGQQGATFFNDLWAFEPATSAWRQLPAGGSVPVARYGTCSGIGPDGRLWISHGFTADGTRFADTVAYDFSSGTWTDETPADGRPVQRCLHGCWWTDAGTFTLYAGQTTGVTALGDLWRLDPAGGWTQDAGTLPSERNLYAFTRVDGATLVFGGLAIDGTYQGGLWRFADNADGAVEMPVTGDEPPGRAGAAMVRDDAGGRILLFGGRDATGPLGDLWSLPLPGE